MASTAFVPDYDDYFRQETHSDVSLLITDDAAVSGDASLARRLPGHSMVLVPFSDYCRAKVKQALPLDSTNECHFKCCILVQVVCTTGVNGTRQPGFVQPPAADAAISVVPLRFHIRCVMHVLSAGNIEPGWMLSRQQRARCNPGMAAEALHAAGSRIQLLQDPGNWCTSVAAHMDDSAAPADISPVIATT